MTGRHWSEGEIDQLRTMLTAGASHREISAAIGRTESACKHKASRLGIQHSRWWTWEEEATVRKYSKSHTSAEIAEMLPGRTPEAIKLFAASRDITLWSREKEVRVSSANGSQRLYTVDHEYFQSIDTPERAYWLGVMFADGSVGQHSGSKRIHLGVAEKDEGWLKAFRSDLGADYPIYRTMDHGEYPHVKMIITSEQLYDALISHGVVERKSYGHPIPDIPAEFLTSFIRGVFDGDGWISIHQRHYRNSSAVGVAGTPAMCRWIKDQVDQGLSFDAGTVREIEPGSAAMKWEVSGNRKVKAFYRWLYTDATRWLDRKRRVFEEHFRTDQIPMEIGS